MNPHTHTHTHIHRCVFNVWIFIRPNRLNLVKSHKCATWSWLNREQAVIYISWLLYIYKYTWMDWQPQNHGIIIFPNGNWGVQYFGWRAPEKTKAWKLLGDDIFLFSLQETRDCRFFLFLKFSRVTYLMFLYIHQEPYDWASVGEAKSRANAFTSWNWTLFVMLWWTLTSKYDI